MFVFVFYFAFGLFAADAMKLPNIFVTCDRNDAKFQECLRLAIEDAFHKLKPGYPSLGIAPLEPLVIPQLFIGRGQGLLSLNLNLKNLQIRGISSLQLLKQNTDLKSLSAQYKAFNKKLILDADYEVDGKIILLPIKGKGKAHIELENVEGNIDITGSTHQQQGETYYDIKKLGYKFNPSKLTIQFDNLFNNKILSKFRKESYWSRPKGDSMNKILNKSWRQVLQETKGGFENALADVFKNIASNLYNRVPLEEVYPIKK